MTDRWLYVSTWIICQTLPGNYVEISKHKHLLKILPKIRFEMRGKFPQTCEPYNTQKYDIKHHRHIFIHMTAALAMSLHAILTFRWKWKGSFYVEISTRILWGKREKYPHRKFSSLSPEFPQGNNAKISVWMIPRWIWMACLLERHNNTPMAKLNYQKPRYKKCSRQYLNPDPQTPNT